jgi:hypothetical protein
MNAKKALNTTQIEPLANGRSCLGSSATTSALRCHLHTVVGQHFGHFTTALQFDDRLAKFRN